MDPMDPMDLKGVYRLRCKKCGKIYIGQTRVSFRTRMAQHKNDITSSKSDEAISGISKHCRHCVDNDVDFDNPEILATFNDKNKGMLQWNCLTRESLEIRRNQSSNPQIGLNDPQLCVRSNAWDPILNEMRDT